MRQIQRPRKLFLFVILLALTGGVAMAANVKEVRRELPLDLRGKVSVETYKGSITVTTWEKPLVEVYARVEPDGTRPRPAEQIASTEVRIEGSGNSVRIETAYEEVPWRWFSDGTRAFVHYTVRMPRSATLEIEDYKSRTRITALEGDLHLNTYKGSVDLEGVRGVELETYKGEVRAQFARFDRPSAFKTYKGDISIELPKDSRFDLDADTGRRGSLRTDLDIATRAGHRFSGEDSYRGAVNGGGPRLRLETYKGSFQIRTR